VFRGVVFDGLDSVFASSYVHSLHSVLKALNNRKHIFTITMKNDFTTIKQQQQRVQAEKGQCLCGKFSPDTEYSTQVLMNIQHKC